MLEQRWDSNAVQHCPEMTVVKARMSGRFRRSCAATVCCSTSKLLHLWAASNHASCTSQVADLLPVADTVTKLASTCNFCGNAARFSLRIAADERQEVVGGAEKYAPVCRRHYIELNDTRS